MQNLRQAILLSFFMHEIKEPLLNIAADFSAEGTEFLQSKYPTHRSGERNAVNLSIITDLTGLFTARPITKTAPFHCRNAAGLTNSFPASGLRNSEAEKSRRSGKRRIVGYAHDIAVRCRLRRAVRAVRAPPLVVEATLCKTT